MSRLSLTGFVVLVAILASAVPAGAGPIDDYRRTGRVNPCNYSDEQLRNGLNGLPPDVQQYAPGLADQLRGGRDGCGGGAAPTGTTGDTRDLTAVPVPTAGGGGTPQAKVPDPPAVKPTGRLKLGDDAISPAIASSPSTPDVPGWLLPLGLLFVFGGLFVAVARARGGLSGDRVARPLQASFEESSDRSADAFAAFRDHLRFR